MQPTDAEIRELLRRRKKEQRRRLRRMKRIRAVLILLMIVSLVFLMLLKGCSHNGDADSGEANSTPPRGVIFIDPGHGGSDPGSDNGERYEKDDTLNFAKAVRANLQNAGFTVYMSREDDTDVARPERLKMAEECNAQLIISVHRNKSQDGNGDGVEMFIPHNNSAESRLLADNLMKAFADQGFSERTVRAGQYMDETSDYDEIATTDIPAVLVETGFINSSKDNQLFDGNFDSNAIAVARALDATFSSLYEKE